MIIREYKKSDEMAVTELCSIVSPRHLRTPEYWEWSNLQNPDGKSLSLVAEEENKIIAHYSILPCRFSVNNIEGMGDWHNWHSFTLIFKI